MKLNKTLDITIQKPSNINIKPLNNNSINNSNNNHINMDKSLDNINISNESLISKSNVYVNRPSSRHWCEVYPHRHSWNRKKLVTHSKSAFSEFLTCKRCLLTVVKTFQSAYLNGRYNVESYEKLLEVKKEF